MAPPAGSGSTGGRPHNTLSGCAQRSPGTASPSDVTGLVGHKGVLNRSLSDLSARTCFPFGPYQGHEAPDNIIPGIILVLHHVMAVVRSGALTKRK